MTEDRKQNIAKEFSWGQVREVHEIGPYLIVEYHPHKYIAGAWTRSNGNDLGKINFYLYVDGWDTSHSCESLDEALATAIAYRREGSNSRAAEYFMRMLPEHP